MDAVAPRLLPCRRLLEPLVVGRLLARGPRLHPLHRSEHLEGPGVDRVPLGAVLHPRPLLVHDVACIAEQLAGQHLARRSRKELRVLDLLDHDQRLRLRPGARLVIALEREEDDEAEQHGEARREDAEDARRAIAVREVAALGGATPDDEHRRHGDRGRGDDDEASPDEVHGGGR